MFSRLLKHWEIKTSTGSHFDVLDGLRGMAILLVVAFHTLYTNPAHGVGARTIGYIIAAGWLGVPVFFVLSGFLISYPFFQKRNEDPLFWYQPGYARRRLGKILPPFYLSIVLCLGFYWLEFHDPAYFNSALKWALGLGNFISISPNFNGVYWSLIVELHFYIILPVMFWCTRGWSVPTTTKVLFMVLFFVPLIARHLVWPAGLTVLPGHETEINALVNLGLKRFPCEMDYFAWGMVFAGIYVRLDKLRAQLKDLCILGYAGFALLVATLLLLGYWEKFWDMRDHPSRWSIEIGHLLPALATLLLLFFVFDPACWGARFFSQSWLRFTGIISYEWFLFHGPVVGLFHEHTGPTHGSLLAYAWRTIAPLVLTFIFSALVYRYFSLPILNRVRDRLKRN